MNSPIDDLKNPRITRVAAPETIKSKDTGFVSREINISNIIQQKDISAEQYLLSECKLSTLKPILNKAGNVVVFDDKAHIAMRCDLGHANKINITLIATTRCLTCHGGNAFTAKILAFMAEELVIMLVAKLEQSENKIIEYYSPKKALEIHCYAADAAQKDRAEIINNVLIISLYQRPLKSSKMTLINILTKYGRIEAIKDSLLNMPFGCAGAEQYSNCTGIPADKLNVVSDCLMLFEYT